MSEQLYDRHYYVIHLKDGRQFKFEDYEHMRSFWMQHAKQGVFDRVIVHDVTKQKEKKGFG